MGTLGAPKEAGNLPLGGGGKPGTEPHQQPVLFYLIKNQVDSHLSPIKV
jgi:hypothetical protein